MSKYNNRYNGYSSRANSFYKSYSMSYNATIAYENGYKPKSKWTKKAMIETIANYLYFMDELETVIEIFKTYKKNDLFLTFYEYKESHHTGKYYNITDFYGLNQDAIDEIIEDLEK